MHTLITGAGQIGSQLALDLEAAGHTATVLLRGNGAVAGATVRSGDAGDRDQLRAAAVGASAIFHCIHTSYSAKTWRAELPQRELAVMDVAAELGIPVVFPESVYAFGRGARDLSETSPLAPASPLGEVRAELLAARAAHPARTASVIASDLFGPTAEASTSVVLGTVLTPAAAGRTAWVMGDPDAPHAITLIPDLSRAMIAAVPLATSGDTVLMAPTAEARSQRSMARDGARVTGQRVRPVRRIPTAVFAIGGLFSPMARELYHQRYLWNAPSVMRPGRLETELGQRPTPWDQALAEWARQTSATSGAPTTSATPVA
ncbi:NAD-dependent epimerase/dehydratase family protein [Leucobacter sp. NPDC058333]|uniref:NAD-dependent epimerase/dehydratase family protein n=1 Tax=Leucobacter sp. NPDC058333 TaxID=3346450 RepID=UPI0036699DC9